MQKDIYAIFNAYAGIITYILNLEKHPQNFENFDQVKQDIEKLLNNSIKQLVQIDEDDFNNLLFPLVAFIDEKILLSNWQLKKRWMSNILQKRYFNTLECGKLFFDKFDKFDENDDAKHKLIYIYFLILGFKGKYYSSEPHQFEELLKINKKYFEERLQIENNDLLAHSYRTTPVEPPKSTDLVFKSVVLFLIICIICAIAFLQLDKELYEKLSTFKKDLDSKIINPNVPPKKVVQKSISKPVIKPKKIDTKNFTLESIFNKPNINYNPKSLEATILITSNSFTKVGVNENDKFYKTLESFSNELLYFIQNNPDIASIRLYSHTSLEHSRYENSYEKFQANLQLSQRRANKLKTYFLQKAVDNNLDISVMKKQFEAMGKGSLYLVRDQNGSEDKVASRRVVIEIKKLENLAGKNK